MQQKVRILLGTVASHTCAASWPLIMCVRLDMRNHTTWLHYSQILSSLCSKSLNARLAVTACILAHRLTDPHCRCRKPGLPLRRLWLWLLKSVNLLFFSKCRKWCRLGSDPKDAEEFVDQACKDGRIMPNAVTVNNLNKLWDAHEQLHG